MFIVGITGMKDPIEGDDKMFFFRVRASYLSAFEFDEFYDIVPIFIPPVMEKIPHYVQMCDGMIFTGGDLDISSKFYSGKNAKDEPYEENCIDKTGRIEFDAELMKAFEKTKKPILGICLGMEIMACVKGCKLGKNISSFSKVKHHEKNSYQDALRLMHDVKIMKNTKLFNIIKDDLIKTNSAHHCFVREVSDKITVCACCAGSGVVEAIECSNHPFMIGFQWHPEAIIHLPEQRKIFNAFALAVKSFG